MDFAANLEPNAFQQPVYPRVLKDIPRFAAITLVAPGERFNALAIFLTPRLSRAIVFNVRMSSFDHARRTTFFFFILVPFVGAGLIMAHLACNAASFVNR
jgi:hypothetical protein